jgi:uncharacterized protein
MSCFRCAAIFRTGILVGLSVLLPAGFTIAQGPLPPSDLTVNASAPGDLAISLFWSDNSLDEIGFEIQRATGESAEFEVISLGTLNNVGSYNDVGLLENTKYTYRVRAYNGNGFSDFSNVDFATTSYARPNQVSQLQGAFVDGLVSLIWFDESDNETRFEVERAEIGVSTAYESIAVLEPNTTSYVDDTTLDGTAYSYRVVPWRFDVAGGAPLTVELATGPAIVSPSRVNAKAKTKSSIELTWGGRFAATTVIQIQRFNLNTGLWESVGEPLASTQKFIDRNLASRTSYSYRLRAKTTTAVSLWESAFATTR